MGESADAPTCRLAKLLLELVERMGIEPVTSCDARARRAWCRQARTGLSALSGTTRLPLRPVLEREPLHASKLRGVVRDQRQPSAARVRGDE